MIGSLCSRGKLDLALKVFDQLLSDNCQPTVITYTILIEATMLDGGVDEALKLLDEMLSRGLKPDMFTYNTIIREIALLNQGKWEEGEKLMSKMFSDKCEPNVVTYSILITTLCRDGKIDEALNLLRLMKEKGLSCDCDWLQVID
uniref:Pentacotripeptide-repeat region of PRORP domain-containing protein n=1 Tax=Brassica oleracea TaxID=3712 RepID=A0A3P6F4H3_BRAOL|nr:unnamed protein product [Brassica oleracea]